jgi:hypothetical protein
MNYGTDDTLHLKNDITRGFDNRKGYVRFDLSSINQFIDDASLKLSFTEDAHTETAVRLFNVLDYRIDTTVRVGPKPVLHGIMPLLTTSTMAVISWKIKLPSSVPLISILPHWLRVMVLRSAHQRLLNFFKLIPIIW